MPKYLNDSQEIDFDQLARNFTDQLRNIHRQDITDEMFELGLRVQIYHVPSRTEVDFKAYLTQFVDSYDPEWNKERVFGRNDAHQVFKGTERIITIGWKVLAASMEEARENMKKMSLLAQMQYPTYDSSVPGAAGTGVYNANAIQASPIFRLKFLNWVQDVKTGNSPNASAKDSGLVGKMAGFKFSPQLDAGVFHDDNGAIYARELQVDLTYDVLHTHNLGFKGRGARQKGFPYGEDISEDSSEFVSRDGRTGLKVASKRSGKTRQQREAIANTITDATNRFGNRAIE